MAVEDKTGWNNFCEQGRPHVGPRCRWILLLNTGVPINQDLQSKAFIFFSNFHMEERAQKRGRKGQGMTLPPPADEVFGKKPFESTFPKFLSSSAENPCRDRIRAKSKGKDCLALIYLSLGISNQQITVIFDLV